MSMGSSNKNVQYRTSSNQEYGSNMLKRKQNFTSCKELDGKNLYETKKYHRLIEKRRRDRINECIYQLKDLLPGEFRKTTSKPMEKAVILEMVVEFMQTLAEKRTKSRGVKSSDYWEGYYRCKDDVLKYFNNTNEQQSKFELIQYLENVESQPHEPKFIPTTTIVSQDSESEGKANRMDGSDTSSSILLKRDVSTEKPNETLRFSSSSGASLSSSSLSSSPSSELSLGPDHSDSSGSDKSQKIPRRKVFHHHRSTSVSCQSRSDKSPSPAVSSNNVSQSTPVFINMPLMMNAGMMPQYVTNGSGVSMSCLMKPDPMQMTQSMIVPQMSNDTSGPLQIKCGMQMPTIFIGPSPVQPMGQQTVSIDQRKDAVQVEPMLVQPTMMMPVQNQGGIICMPSFSMTPQFSSATINS